MLHTLVLEILDLIILLYIVSFHKAGWGSMLIFLKMMTCSSVSVNIVCDNPGHSNMQ